MTESQHRSPMPFSPPTFWLLALAWLPLGILLSALLRHLPGLATGNSLSMSFGMLAGLVSLAILAPFGLPLALAWRQMQRTGHARAAWTAFGILAPLTAFASLFAGLLGPFAIGAYAIVLSLPAWIVYFVIRARNAPQRT